ncbi:hypothetical protein Fot_18814 [Forsythia ovata]|uniref:BURP domain-containing protein n=1 Tax=Forsythia ovata TaxID=205694 RepID=A0ABD1VLC3_9LAMI
MERKSLRNGANGRGARKIAGENLSDSRNQDHASNQVKIQDFKENMKIMLADHHKMHIEHVHADALSSPMDPSLNVFFLEEDLKQGNSMPIYFPRRGPSSSHLLSREEADSIPFESSKVPNLLEFFTFLPGSPQAKAMEETLQQCETKPIKGETKFCATSLESMLNFVQMIFGFGTEIKVFSTIHLRQSNVHLQKYTIIEVPEEISAPKLVACHTMPYPYAVYYCHHQESKSKVFKVYLSGENGDSVEAIAVCHMDTSNWSHNHVSFRMLGIEPGTSPVCHFFPADNFAWVPSTTLMQS